MNLIVQGDLKTFLVAISLHKSRLRMLDIKKKKIEKMDIAEGTNNLIQSV